jgi:hypothetical protein
MPGKRGGGPGMKTRYPGSGLAAFLIIIVLAPPLGGLGPLTYMSIREAILTENKITLAWFFEEERILKFFLWSYLLAGASASIASIYAGIRIYLTRWVSRREAVVLAAVLAPLIPAIFISIFGALDDGYPDWLGADFLLFALETTLLSIALAIVTALILRVIMLQLKILVPPAATADNPQ